MYIGTISSLFDNPFKYNIKLKNLPFGLMSKIKNEVYVLSDLGKRKLTIKIIKQNVVITSCCNITFFCRVNAQHQFLLIKIIKRSDAVLSCCFVVPFG